jgi:hypothetical protein
MKKLLNKYLCDNEGDTGYLTWIERAGVRFKA